MDREERWRIQIDREFRKALKIDRWRIEIWGKRLSEQRYNKFGDREQ